MLFDDRATEAVRKRYEDALAWLRDVAAGRVSIPGATAVARDGVTGTGAVALASPAIVFTTELLAKAQVGE
jgi:phage gp36-like protein